MPKQYLTIKSWAEDEKPREKLVLKGVSALSTSELFAILLRSGVGGESALDLSRRILSDCNNDLNLLARQNVRDLMNKYKGVGIAKATAIIAAVELGNRRNLSETSTPQSIRSSSDIYKYIAPLLHDLDHEEFWVIYLNRANHAVGRERISTGGMNGTVIDIRLLYRKAIDAKANSIIIAHNHPSSSTEPSKPDKMLTEKIREAGKLIDIKLLDHLIIGGKSYFSFVDAGLFD